MVFIACVNNVEVKKQEKENSIYGPLLRKMRPYYGYWAVLHF